MSKKSFKYIKLIILAIVLILLIFITIKLFPFFINLSTEEGRIDFNNQVESMGAFGVFAILGLQSLQILAAFLPGEPIEFLAGMCYGTFYGMLLIFIGCFISSAIIFFAVRKFGTGFIESFFGSDKIDKLKNNKLIKNKEKLEIIMLILFIIPGTPKDFFVYIAGLLPIKPLRFLLISTFARFPSVITSTFAGNNASNGNWHISLIAYGFTIIISIIGIIIYKKIVNNHRVNENT